MKVLRPALIGPVNLVLERDTADDNDPEVVAGVAARAELVAAEGNVTETRPRD